MTFVTDTHPFVHHVTGRRNRLGRRALRIFDGVKRGRETMVVPFTVLEKVYAPFGRSARFAFPYHSSVILWSRCDRRKILTWASTIPICFSKLQYLQPLGIPMIV